MLPRFLQSLLPRQGILLKTNLKLFAISYIKARARCVFVCLCVCDRGFYLLTLHVNVYTVKFAYIEHFLFEKSVKIN